MRTKVMSIAGMLLCGALSVFAENKTEKIEVKGNCGMCEKRIEKAALAVEGVSKADWNKETKMMEVVFDDSKTKLDKVEIAIAQVGHDTPHHKATAEVYDKLPGCCKYDRSKVKKEHSHEGHQH